MHLSSQDSHTSAPSSSNSSNSKLTASSPRYSALPSLVPSFPHHRHPDSCEPSFLLSSQTPNLSEIISLLLSRPSMDASPQGLPSSPPFDLTSLFLNPLFNPLLLRNLSNHPKTSSHFSIDSILNPQL